mmetsp:Transcript_1810/g.4622  ORF Transcript_1810/g.4622 Transcript_1810/m.4622 type:complete len:273 (+) Transcript_1810:492-1310(+)
MLALLGRLRDRDRALLGVLVGLLRSLLAARARVSVCVLVRVARLIPLRRGPHREPRRRPRRPRRRDGCVARRLLRGLRHAGVLRELRVLVRLLLLRRLLGWRGLSRWPLAVAWAAALLQLVDADADGQPIGLLGGGGILGGRRTGLARKAFAAHPLTSEHGGTALLSEARAAPELLGTVLLCLLHHAVADQPPRLLHLLFPHELLAELVVRARGRHDVVAVAVFLRHDARAHVLTLPKALLAIHPTRQTAIVVVLPLLQGRGTGQLRRVGRS